MTTRTPANALDCARLSPREEALLALVDADEVVALLQALIRARSDNPPGDTRRAAQVATAVLHAAGLSVVSVARQPHQPNVLATLGQPEAAPRLMFHAQLDTAPVAAPDDWLLPPFGAEIKGANLYGRGAQTKGSTAAQVMAVVALARAGEPLIGSLHMLLAADGAAAGQNGTRWLHDRGLLAAKALVVGAPTNNQVAIAERVACALLLTVHGRHSARSMPYASENAPLKLTRALIWMNRVYRPRLHVHQHLYLPPSTLTLDKLQGGLPWNLDAECCQATLTRMLLPCETSASALAELTAALDEYNATVEPLRYELTLAGADGGANVNTPPTDPLVALAQAALTASGGVPRPLTGCAQASAGRWFTNDRLPIILFGPGDPALSAVTDEHVAVNQVVAAARCLALLALRRLGA